MAVFALSIFAVGVVGMAFATFAGSLIAGLMGEKRRALPQLSTSSRLKIELLVAAHNEEATVEQTLNSLARAADRLRSAVGDVFDLSISVGLDHCTDRTVEIVEAFARASNWAVKGVENPLQGSKWLNLKTLIGQAQGDWVALVDCGSVWEDDLLVAAWAQMLDPTVLGVSPSYSPKGAGGLEKLNWKLERTLKTLENRAGGPISVHGATVLYRLASLQNAMHGVLAGNHWFNDDVVVPLSLRLENPQGRMVYLENQPASGAAGWVRDVGVVLDLEVEYRRRRRMVVGNVQWVQGILVPRLFADVRVTLLASRRVFRLLWAYWVLSIGLGAFGLATAGALAIENISLQLLALAGIGAIFAAVPALLYMRSNWVRRVFMAFVSGLMVPRFWFQDNGVRGVSWV